MVFIFFGQRFCYKFFEKKLVLAADIEQQGQQMKTKIKIKIKTEAENERETKGQRKNAEYAQIEFDF